MNKETFCSFPFNTFFLSANGGVKTCCSSRMDIGNINQNTIEEIVHGKLAKEIRQCIVDNKWHKACYQCKEIETVGGRSERTAVLDYDFEKFYNATVDTFKLEKIDLRWTNLCNLTCTYCYEAFSSNWASLKGIKINANKDEAEEKVFNFINNNKETIISINLLGGEPLLQKQNATLFDILPNKNYYILTNLSVDIEKNKLIHKLLDMPNVQWGISFENIGKKFEYVRHGAKWETLVKNLRFLHNHLKTQINVHPLYSIYNAYDLCDLYQFFEEEGYLKNQFWAVLLNIRGLSVFIQNDLVRKKSLIELDKCIEKYSSQFDMSQLISFKESLEKSSYDEYSLAEFYKFLTNLEQKYITDKDFKFKELWPEIYSDILGYNK